MNLAIFLALLPSVVFANQSRPLYLKAESASGVNLPCGRPTIVKLEVLLESQSFDLNVDAGGCFPSFNSFSGQATRSFTENPNLIKIDLLAESVGIGGRLVQSVTLGAILVDRENQLVTLKTISSLFAPPYLDIKLDQESIKIHTTELRIKEIGPLN